MVYVLVAPGFEEIEALVPVDILRRAGIEVQTVGMPQSKVTGAHGITIQCDLSLAEVSRQGLQMVLLPGGMPGTTNLGQTPQVKELVEFCAAGGLWIGAICAAPMLLGQWGLLKGRRATCYPGFEKELLGATHTGGAVEQDGPFITARDPGAAFAFAMRLARALKGEEAVRIVQEGMGCV